MIIYTRLFILLLFTSLLPFTVQGQEATDSLRTTPRQQTISVEQGIRKVSLSSLESPLDERGNALPEAALVYNTNPETGKGLYYWNGAVWAQVMADDDGDPESDSTQPSSTKEFLEAFAKLIGALAWPATLMFILFFFRSGFSSAIKRVGGFKVDNTGLSVNFSDVIAAGADTIADLKKVAIAKSGGLIQPRKASSPYVQLINIKSDISNDLDRKARSAGVAQGPAGIHNRLDQLVGAGQMDYAEAEMIRTLTGVIEKADRNVTQEQVDQIEQMFNNINL